RLTRAAAQPAQQPALLAAGSLALSLALCAHRPLGRGLETGGGRLAGLSRPAGWTVRGLAAGPLAHLRVAGGALRAAAVLRLLRREDGRPAVVARRAALRLLRRRVRHGRRAVVVVVGGGRLLRLPEGDAPPAGIVHDRLLAAARRALGSLWSLGVRREAHLGRPDVVLGRLVEPRPHLLRWRPLRLSLDGGHRLARAGSGSLGSGLGA